MKVETTSDPELSILFTMYDYLRTKYAMYVIIHNIAAF